ncbi:MAG: hypothetical protein FJX11_14890 [Alphaproteobacteria bacterium]|nr:hypothetical protein [Alphaproteobacteria bacterium]
MTRCWRRWAASSRPAGRRDRTSAATMRANQLRLWFASMAYVLLAALRRIGPAGSQFADATCGTIRLKLLKIGALVRLTVRRRLPLPGGIPQRLRLARRGRSLMTQTAHRRHRLPAAALPRHRPRARNTPCADTSQHTNRCCPRSALPTHRLRIGEKSGLSLPSWNQPDGMCLLHHDHRCARFRSA